MITHSLAASFLLSPLYTLKATSNPPSVVPEKRVFPPSNLPILPQNQSHQFFEYLLNIFLCSLLSQREQHAPVSLISLYYFPPRGRKNEWESN